jgi:diguanylate cyclase (GGDEF)-like protein
MKVLVADDDPVPRRIVEASLHQAGYTPVLAVDGMEVLRILGEPDPPRLIVLDWLMPRLDGLGVCRAIRAGRQEPYTYVLLLTANDRPEDIIEGLDAGADDYVTKPCNVYELRARLRAASRLLELQDQLVAAREALREQATHDPLTNLLNRSAVLAALQIERSRADRAGIGLAVLMVDVDHFKAINDTHGHVVGDDVLREVARRMRMSVRTYDAIGRYGGEEFLVVAPGCGVEAARELAERLRACVAHSEIAVVNTAVAVTVSLGVASIARALDADRLLPAADRALYEAKARGRNCVVVDPASSG